MQLAPQVPGDPADGRIDNRKPMITAVVGNLNGGYFWSQPSTNLCVAVAAARWSKSLDPVINGDLAFIFRIDSSIASARVDLIGQVLDPDAKLLAR